MWTLLTLLAASPSWAIDDEESLPSVAPVRGEGSPQTAGDGALLDLDVGAGLMVHMDSMGVGTRVVGGLGWTARGTRGRLRLHGELGWARVGHTTRIEVPRLSQVVDSRLGVHRVDLGLGTGWSLVGDGAELDLELYATPALALVHSRGKTRAADVALGVGRETSVRPMLSVGIGITGPLNRGEACAQLGLTLVDLSGVQLGAADAAQIGFIFHYRPNLVLRRGA